MLQRVLSLQGVKRGVHGVQASQKAKQHGGCASWCRRQAAYVGGGEQGAAEVAEAALDPFDDAGAVHHEGLEGVVGGNGWVEAHGEHIVEDVGTKAVVTADVKEGVQAIDIVCE